MAHLTAKELKKLVSGLPDDTLVYLGDDEEMNGIHEAYYCQTEDLTSGDSWVRTMIEDSGTPLPKQNENQVVILIS